MKTKLLFILLLISITGLGQTTNPGWNWAKSYGGNNYEEIRAIATDANGNAYIVGYFESTTLKIGNTILTNANSISSDLFLAKFDSLGNALWAKSIGGSSQEDGFGIAVDATGNIYICGTFSSPTLVVGATTLTNSGSLDMFVAKLDPSGNFVWAKKGNCSGNEACAGIAVDVSGNILVAGSIVSGSTNISFGTIALGHTSLFTVKYDSSGTLIWAKGIPSGAGVVHGMTTDPNGNVFLTGEYSGTSITFGSHVLINSGGGSDIFVAKYDSSGIVAWAKTAGGINKPDYGLCIAADSYGNVIVSGLFQTDTLVLDTARLINSYSHDDVFLVKYDSTGHLLWAKSIWGQLVVNGLTVDPVSNIYVTGGFYSYNLTFDPFYGLTNSSASSSNDLFLASYLPNGQVNWLKKSIGAGNEGGVGIAINANGQIYLGGVYVPTSTTTITLGTDVIFDTTYVNYSDIFVTQLKSTCESGFTVSPTATPHVWTAQNLVSGYQPVSCFWQWGDGDTITASAPSHTYFVPGFYDICLTVTDAKTCSATFCDSSTYLNRNDQNQSIITINVQYIVSGVNEIAPDQKNFRVYPNPSNGRLTIQSDREVKNLCIEINNLQGELLYTEHVPGFFSTELNLENYSRGVYVLKLVDSETGNQFIGKLLIQ